MSSDDDGNANEPNTSHNSAPPSLEKMSESPLDDSDFGGSYVGQLLIV